MKSIQKLRETLIQQSQNPLFISEVLERVDEWHRHHFRKSGAPYVKHLYETAYQLSLWGFGDELVATGLLHDVMEDQGVSYEELKTRFGKKIADMVDGLTKIKKLSNEEEQNKLETYRKFFTYLDKNYGLEILAVKLADRLNNLQELEPLRVEKRLRILSETLSFYLPIAVRFGAIDIANKILKVYFQNAQHSSFQNIIRTYKSHYRLHREHIARHLALLKRIFRDTRALITVKYFSLYDIYTRGEEIIQKNPIIFQILIPEEEDPIPFLEFFKNQYHYHVETEDHWFTPLPNAHRMVIAKHIDQALGNVEIHIEPETYALLNRLGFIYVLSNPHLPQSSTILSRYQRTIRQISEKLGEVQELEDLFELMQDTFQEQKIIVISPKNELISLPQRSTALDYAFKIHSRLGSTATRIFVNNYPVPFNQTLKMGDRIFVERSQEIQIRPEWYFWVNTYTARREIRRYLKSVGLFEKKEKQEAIFTIDRKEYSRFLSLLNNYTDLLGLEIIPSHEIYFIKISFIGHPGELSEFVKNNPSVISRK